MLDSFLTNSVIHEESDGSRWVSVWVISVQSTVPGSLKTWPHHVTCENKSKIAKITLNFNIKTFCHSYIHSCIHVSVLWLTTEGILVVRRAPLLSNLHICFIVYYHCVYYRKFQCSIAKVETKNKYFVQCSSALWSDRLCNRKAVIYIS